MDRILDEIGKLRHEMQVGFIEVDNRFEQVSDAIERVSNTLKDTRGQVGKVATLMDGGLELITQYIKDVQTKQELRIQKIEERLDKAGL